MTTTTTTSRPTAAEKQREAATFARAFHGLIDHLGLGSGSYPEIHWFALECVTRDYNPGDVRQAEAVIDAAEDVSAMYGISVDRVMTFARPAIDPAVAA